MISPIADFLPVFAAGRPSGRTLDVRRFVVVPDGFDDETPAGLTTDEMEERIAEARRVAEAEAAAALDAALAIQAADLETRHAANLTAARLIWAEEQGVVLAETLKTGLDDLETTLMENLVHVLEPFFGAATRARAVEELRLALGALIAHGQGASIKVRGPRDLLAALRDAFAEKDVLAFEEAEVAEVTIESDDTTIRSQLQAWADTLRSYLDEARR